MITVPAIARRQERTLSEVAPRATETAVKPKYRRCRERS